MKRWSQAGDQATFVDGRMVKPTDSSVEGGERWVRPRERGDFSLAVKSGAMDANSVVEEVCEQYGEELRFSSRETAERFAQQLSSVDGALRVQGAAPNDLAEVDAYLLADHAPSVADPKRVSDAGTMTFDVGANLYGALGETIITGAPRSYAVEHFVEQDLADVSFRDELRVRVRDAEYVSFGDQLDGYSGWAPDCKLVVYDGWGRPPVEEYWCEVKTGDASFERTQVAAMRELAGEERVLKIRVRIDNLPDEYSVRIHEVEPAEE